MFLEEISNISQPIRRLDTKNVIDRPDLSWYQSVFYAHTLRTRTTPHRRDGPSVWLSAHEVPQKIQNHLLQQEKRLLHCRPTTTLNRFFIWVCDWESAHLGGKNKHDYICLGRKSESEREALRKSVGVSLFHPVQWPTHFGLLCLLW